MELAAADQVLGPQAEQGGIEGAFEGMPGRLGDRHRGGGGQGSLHEPDRLAGQGRKASGKARLLEPAHRRGERFAISFRQIHTSITHE